MKKYQISGLLILVLATISVSIANTIVIDTDDTGWYNQYGYHSSNNKNSSVGVTVYGDDIDPVMNSYFLFSIPEITDEISDVTLCLEVTRYWGEDAYENLLISPVSIPSNELVLSHGYVESGRPPAVHIYNDLMSGPELGVMRVDVFRYGTYKKPGPLFYCDFNDYGKELIQDAAGGQFAIGLSIMGLDGERNEGLSFGNGYGDDTVRIYQLQITTIPEPATMILLLTGTIFLKKKNNK